MSTIKSDRFVATAQFNVRYAETDAQGIVHHAAYIVWLEEARSHFARSTGLSYADIEKSGYFMSVISVEAHYKAAAHYDELIAVDCWVETLKSRTVTFGYQVRSAINNTLYLTAQTEHICVTHEGKVTTWPAEIRQWLGSNSTPLP